MKSVTLRTGHRRFAVALSLVGVTMLVFASVAGAQTSPSEYPPPPPSPLAPPDWDFDQYPERPFAGDANLSGAVTAGDAAAILLHAMLPPGAVGRLSSQQLMAADTYGRGFVTAGDAAHILQYAMDPTGNLGVLTSPLWDFDRPLQHGLRDPRGANAG